MGDIAPPFLITVLKRGERSASSPRRFAPWTPFYKRLRGPQRLSASCGKKKISCLCHESKPGHPARSVDTVLTYPRKYLVRAQTGEKFTVGWTSSTHRMTNTEFT
jgi:hypothetical protein